MTTSTTTLSATASLLALAATACSGSTADPGPLTREDAELGCATRCAHEAACGEIPAGSEPACVAECADRITGWMRTDVLEIVAACVDGAACTLDEDTCFAEVEPLAIHRQWQERCLEVMPACLDPGESEHYCDIADPASNASFITLVASPIADHLVACFDLPTCTDADACIDQVFADEIGLTD